MKNTVTNAKSANTLNGELKKDLLGTGNIFQLMDLVAEKLNYLTMLQTNGKRETEVKHGNRSK